MMQKTRSGLAAAAASMQLTDAPEGKSSLQNRLSEAEKRAQQAELSAQDAQVMLARTLLEAARVEAVVTARVKAEREAEIEALKAQLEAARRASAAQKRPPQEARGSVDGQEGAAVPALRSPGPIGAVVLTEWDLPPKADDDMAETPPAEVADAARRASRTPMRIVLLAVVLVVSIVSYSITARHMIEQAGVPATAVVAKLMSAFDAFDLRSMDPRAAPPMATTAEGGWLLYMPVEPAAVAAYLGGPAHRNSQLAVKNATTVSR